MRSWLSPLLLLSSFFLVFAGCGDSSGGPGDGGSADAPVDAPPPCDETFSYPAGDADGHADPLGASESEARAGRLEAGELPPDPTGLSTVEQGDYVLANDRVALIIEGPGPSDSFDPWGGKPVGIAAVEDGALVRPADFNEVMIAVSRFIVETTEVGVVADGSDGGAAVVRAVGTLNTIPFLRDFPGVETIAPGELQGLSVKTDYVLEPGAEHVDVRMRVGNTGNMQQVKVLALVFQKARMPAYGPVDGFEPGIGDTFPYMAWIQEDGTSYALESPDGELDYFLEVSDAMVLQAPRVEVPGCGELDRVVARLHIGGPGVDGLREALARTRGEATREIGGTVRNADGSPAEGVRVHAESADGAEYLTRALTDETGAYSLHVPDGAEARLQAWRRGDEVAGPVTVAAGESTADLDLAEVGFIRVSAEDAGDGTPLPVRVQVEPLGDLPSVPGTFGEPPVMGGRLHTVFPADGDVTLRVPVGDHRVVVSRGYEYSIEDRDVTVASGETVDVIAALDRVVDTTDTMCGDFHIHTHRSPDSEDSPDLKLRSALGDGVEVPLRSDHEWVNDFEPVLADLGLEEWAFGVASLELTTFSWGHMGVFPLEPDPSAVNGGAVPWVDRLPPEVFADVRSRAGDPVIIINHPRSFGTPIGAYFEAAGYDPATGMVDNPEMWDEEFMLVEVFNDSSFDENLMGVVKDWFSMLSSGRRVFATGSSDSHEILPGSPVGYPRTCLDVGTDDAATLRSMGSAHVRDVAVAGDMVINGGIHVQAETVSGAIGPGGDLMGAAETELVHVRVQAPCWVDVDTLEVWVDGEMRESIDIAPDGVCDPLRFEGDVMVPVAAGSGSWAIFHAKGDMPLTPVTPGAMPFGVTNPIFLRR